MFSYSATLPVLGLGTIKSSPQVRNDPQKKGRDGVHRLSWFGRIMGLNSNGAGVNNIPMPLDDRADL